MSRFAALAALLATASVATADAAVPQGNLVRNPGAEGGSGKGASVTVPRWDIGTTSFTAVQYGTPSTLALDQAPPNAGANFFAGGDGSELATGSQEISVRGAAPEIDQCSVEATVGGYFGGLEGQGDTAGADITFHGGGGVVIDTLQLGFPTAADRGGASGMLPFSQTTLVPAGTRSIEYAVSARRAEGTFNDGYADNLSLTLAQKAPPSGSGTEEPPPEPRAGQSLVLNVVRGTVTYTYDITLLIPGGVCQAPAGVVQMILDRLSVLIAFRPVIDASRGAVELVAAAANGAQQRAEISRGKFMLRQDSADTPLTELVMRGGKFSKCTKGSRRVVRRLFGSGKGRFRTRGRFSSATVRGTTWRTIDRCDGTLTRVPRSATGSKVTVRDLVRRRTVTLRPGESYLAKRRG